MTGVQSGKNKRGGFTLIELLVVIILIALLSGMTVVVVRTAMRAGKASAIQMQLTQLAMALDGYKNKVGEYPPDDYPYLSASLSESAYLSALTSDVAMRVERHFKKRWPRARYDSTYFSDANGFTVSGPTDNLFTVTSQAKNESGVVISGSDYVVSIRDYNLNGELDFMDAMITRINLNGVNHSNLNYPAPLIFWLGGLFDENNNPSGFYLSPTDPLGYHAQTQYDNQKEELSFKFPKPVFNEEVSPAALLYFGDLPVAYFRAEQKHYDGKYWNGNYASSDGGEDMGWAMPYAKTNAVDADGSLTDWYEPDRFQLIHPGSDKLFGGVAALDESGQYCPRVVGTQHNISSEDEDNVTNFSKGATLGSEY